MAGFQVTFKRPSTLGPDAALALEDYARAISSYSAVAITSADGRVTGIDLVACGGEPAEEITREIERFFDSLAADSADRLGWN